MIVIHDDDAKNSSEVNGAVYSVYQTERNKFDYYTFLPCLSNRTEQI